MLTRSLFLAGAALLAGGAALLPTPTAEAVATPAEGEVFDIDLGHSSIHFDIEHLSVSRAWGRFDEFEGSFTVGDDADDMAVELTVKTESVNTNSGKRDEHLRSADFFNARQFPELKFVSTGVEKAGEDKYTLTGDLTMLGTKQSIEAEMTMIGRGPDPWGGTRAGAMATFTIDRFDFGMETYEGTLGQEVNVRVDLEGILRQ